LFAFRAPLSNGSKKAQQIKGGLGTPKAIFFVGFLSRFQFSGACKQGELELAIRRFEVHVESLLRKHPGSFFRVPVSKAAENTRLLQKNSFFCEKNGGFVLFSFALFARAMCGAGKGVLGDSLRLQRKVSPIFSESRPLFSSAPKVLGP
jgi:hypothetical protein